MKYIRISTHQGAIYLDLNTKKDYVFPPYFPKLISKEIILSFMCVIALFSTPFIYFHTQNIHLVFAVLFCVSCALYTVLHYGWKAQERFYDRCIDVGVTKRLYVDIHKLFLRQVFRNITASLLAILVVGFLGVVSLLMIKIDGDMSYRALTGAFCSGPLLLAFLMAIRPIGTVIDYLWYREVLHQQSSWLRNVPAIIALLLTAAFYIVVGKMITNSMV